MQLVSLNAPTLDCAYWLFLSALVAALALRKFVLDILPRGVFGAVSHLAATALVAAGLVHLHQWMEQQDGGLLHWGCLTCFWLVLDIVRSTTSHSSVLVV